MMLSVLDAKPSLILTQIRRQIGQYRHTIHEFTSSRGLIKIGELAKSSETPTERRQSRCYSAIFLSQHNVLWFTGHIQLSN